MERYRATIYKEQQTVLEGLTVYLEVVTKTTGLKSWYGVFQLEKAGDCIEPGGPYELRLDDGRRGQILVSNVVISSSPTQVSFQGSGPLAKAD